MTSGLGPIFDQHPLPHFVFDLQTLEILAANDAAVARYGYSRDELLAMKRTDLLEPGDRPAIRAFLDGLPETARQPEQPVWRERHRDGHELRADVRGMTIDYAGRAARLTVVTDASPRLQVVEQVRLQRELATVAGRVASVGGWRLDVASGQVHWSDEVCAIHGLPPGSTADLRTAARHYPGEAAAQLGAAVTACIKQGTAFDLELPFVTAQGQSRWVRAAGVAVRNADGRVVALHGAQQDITERKLAEIELAQSRARLAAVVRALPDLWIVYDDEERYLEVSDPEHPSLSAPWSQKVGRKVAETIDEALLQQMREGLEEARRSGRLRPYAYTMATKDGVQRHFEARSVPMEGGRWMSLVRDNTETVHLEQRFRRLADTAPLCIFEADAEGLCTYVNAVWNSQFGLDVGQALGRGLSRAVHPEDSVRVSERWQRAVAQGAPFEDEFRLIAGDGSVRTVSVRSSPTRQPDGRVASHVGTITDLTAQRELERVRRAGEVAEEARKRLATFLSRLSHELRTPLNAIIGFTELLLMQGLPAAQVGQLGHVRDAGRHMLALVDDLLVLQQLQQGALARQIEPVPLAELLQASVALLEAPARRREVRIALQVPPGLTLHTDRRGLQQVLLNLGSNAVKYGRAAGHVLLHAEASADGVAIVITDDGEGITPEQMARLFQPFERLGREHTKEPGSGLGLIITRQLVEWLGGELVLASTPGQGTTATVRLPLQPPG